MTSTVRENLFLDGLDYFIFDAQRNVRSLARGEGAVTFEPSRNERVIDWALAWPDLAPHATRLLFDSQDRIRHVRTESTSDAPEPHHTSIRCERWDDEARKWVPVPLVLGDDSEPLTAFEAAIVCHGVLRPREPPIPVTFSRGDASDWHVHSPQGTESTAERHK